MNRRDLFSKLATIAAAVTLAPAAKAEAGPEYAVTTITTPDIGVPVDAALYVQGKTVLDGDLIVNGRSLTDLLADARAEGYIRGYDVAEARAESRAMRGFRAVPIGEPHESMSVTGFSTFTQYTSVITNSGETPISLTDGRSIAPGEALAIKRPYGTLA